MSLPSKPFRLAVTADLHYGTRHTAGNDATRALAGYLLENQPDALVIAGDIGAGQDFSRCLELFAGLHCLKALVPGNHDIWVTLNDVRGDSYNVYQQHLPRLATEQGFHYLDHGPLLLPEFGLAIAGSINWYDYSWAIDDLKAATPDWEERLRWKRFQRGKHNDANYVRWAFNDQTFTLDAVQTLTRHIDESLARMDRAIVVTHHPPFQALNYPAAQPPELDDLLWRAFSGNTLLEEALQQRAERIALAFCGHTHRAREANFAGIKGYNVGGDYHFKRLLVVDWPGGLKQAIDFE